MLPWIRHRGGDYADQQVVKGFPLEQSTSHPTSFKEITELSSGQLGKYHIGYVGSQAIHHSNLFLFEQFIDLQNDFVKPVLVFLFAAS